jgi:hypothetical protein
MWTSISQYPGTHLKIYFLLILFYAGLNLSRMLGDGFLKTQDSRFISEPYVSEALHVTKDSTSAFALVAR